MKRRYRFYPVVLLLGLCLTTRVHADPASPQEMRQVCRAWLDHRVAAQGGWSGSPVPEITGEQPITQGDDVLGYAFQVAPQGFILVPAHKELCPVWFFSETGALDITTDNVAAQVLRGRLAMTTEIATGKAGSSNRGQRELVAAAGVKNRSRWAEMTVNSAAWVTEHTQPAEGLGPLLSTAWHQGPPYNLFCPLGGDSARCVAGCTPIAAAQIARYHAYPPSGGTGEEFFSWAGDRCRSPRSGAALLHADFRDAYDWESMPNACVGSCGSKADSAVAELCYELGVGGHADYGTNCGTSTPLDGLVLALQEHFGYDRFTDAVYRSQVATAHDWFNLLRDEIIARRPVLYCFTWLAGTEQHALVCDGWSIDTGIEYLSLNLGGGGVTGWFAADDNGMSRPLLDNAILHLAPPPLALTVGPNGDGDYTTIQLAINAAREGAVITLLDGVYHGPGNRDLNCLGKQITIRSRSGAPALCVLDCEGGANDQHRAFVFNHNESLTTVIEGITIRNGYVSSYDGTNPALGGAVICEIGPGNCGSGSVSCASPRFTNCVFSQNRSDRGGAIACSGPAAPLIATCVFWKNTALEGGAFSKTGSGMAQIDSSTFYRNSAPSGSGLYVGLQGALLLTRSIVTRNQIGGGIYLADGGTARLTCCDLYANDGGDWIGGIGDQLNRAGNIAAHPMFCDAENRNLDLDVISPCAQPACGRIGARPASCGGFTHYVGAAPQYRYKTIAQALAVAGEGARIVLMDSLYAGEGNRDLTIPRRGLTIESAALDPVTCVLDVQGDSAEPHRAFSLLRKHGVTLRGITVRHGWMSTGGAIYAESSDSAQILSCAFRECAAGGSFTEPGGGAVYVYGDSSHGGRTVLRDCSFEACTSHTDGGAVSLSYRDFADTVLVENCTFSSSTARDRGGAFAGSRARVKISNSVLRTNAAANGGAVMVGAESRLWFESCTLVGNAATGKGESVYLDGTGTESHFKNCILATDTGRLPIACSSTPGITVTVACCDVWPDESDSGAGCLSDWQNGNIRADPQFCAPETGDYQLRATSPCGPDRAENQGCGLVGALPVGCWSPVTPGAENAKLAFRRCGPNPFHHEIRIDYVIPAHAETRPVDISIYDAGGRLVRTVFRGTVSPGEHSAHWDALDDHELRVGSGVFFCRLHAGAQEATRRLIVLR